MPNRVDSMLSQGMGKVKAVKARLKGLVGVFKTLTEQHGEVTALLQRARTSEDKFRDLWPEIKRELKSHEQAETAEVIPELRAHEATRALAEHHDAEARVLDALIAQIDEMANGSDERKELYQKLIDTVVHHAKEEEGDLFPKAQEAIGKDRAEALEAPFLATKHAIASKM